jgi:hypothetical protein
MRCGLRVKRHRAKGIAHTKEFGIQNAEKREGGSWEKGKLWSQVTTLIKYVFYSLSALLHALVVIIPTSPFRLPNSISVL